MLLKFDYFVASSEVHLAHSEELLQITPATICPPLPNITPFREIIECMKAGDLEGAVLRRLNKLERGKSLERGLKNRTIKRRFCLPASC